MEYAKIVAVTGLPGLFELVSSKSDGAIVRALEDKSTKFVSSRIHNFSHLESIEVYTVRDNVNLVDIFTAMDTTGDKLPDEKDNAAVKKYFEKVFPDLDFERVYSSDMKKMIKWFSVLKSNDVEIKLRQPEEEGIEEAEVVEEGAATEEKAARSEKPKAAKESKAKEETVEKEPVAKKEAKPAAKKSAAKKEEGEEEAPKKKAAPKAKKEDAADGEKKETPAKKKAAASKDKPKK